MPNSTCPVFALVNFCVANSFHVPLETESRHGLSSVPYQCKTTSPKNIHVTAPNARYGPKGNLADQTGFPTTSVTKPITEPRSDPVKRLNNTARHPRNAPIAARNFRSEEHTSELQS